MGPRILLALCLTVTSAQAADWPDTLERVADGVLSIRVDGTRAFDTEWNQSSQATGFVVDAQRGIVLTNRHVVMPGPVVAQGVFRNLEEVELHPLYRDPVHDFGFYRFDPEALRFIEPAELALAPEGAVVGRDIRIIGNDAGEQLSILSGTLARLDREAPAYGRGNYNDFNTFYYQAASGTSGGSSGSPVIDIQGRVIALNAGARNDAQSSFFLPLDRVVRALEHIQRGEVVPRGTLQTTFVHRTYDEVRPLGLTTETEARTRALFPTGRGLLTVDYVLPGGPAANVLRSGDILLEVDGRRLVDFITLESIMDDAVGQTVSILVQRGGEDLDFELTVQDLHSITPARFLEIGGGVVHDLSYQQARNMNVPVSGVFVANSGYMLANAEVPRGAVIHEVDSDPVSDLDGFLAAIADVADREHVSIRYAAFEDTSTTELRDVRMDRRWFPVQLCHRDDVSGWWPCEPVEGPGTPPPLQPASTTIPDHPDPRADALAHSLVLVEFDIPYPVSGVTEPHYYGTGLVVDADRGLVVVDRNTVPLSIGDAVLTFAGSVEVPGEVVYLHPLHNLAVLSYDTELLGDTPVRSARVIDEPLDVGEETWVVGLRADSRIMVQPARVASVDPVTFPLSSTFRFRESNVETVSLVNGPDTFDGVLVDERGRVRATWSSFAYQGGRSLSQSNAGLPAGLIQEVTELARAEEGELRSLEVEFQTLPLNAARRLGLSQDWAERVEEASRERRVLQVARVVRGAPVESKLRPGDLVLAVDGETVTGFRQLERAVQVPEVTVTVVRDGRLGSARVETVALGGRGVERVLVWGGALLQEPHRVLAAQRGIERTGVFVARYYFGTPANRYGLYAGRLITEVNGIATPDLDSFMQVVNALPEDAEVRVTTRNWDRRVEVKPLKLDPHYWPAYLVERTDDGWERRSLR